MRTSAARETRRPNSTLGRQTGYSRKSDHRCDISPLKRTLMCGHNSCPEQSFQSESWDTSLVQRPDTSMNTYCSKQLQYNDTSVPTCLRTGGSEWRKIVRKK